MPQTTLPSKTVLTTPLEIDSLKDVISVFEPLFINRMRKKKVPGAAVVIIKDTSIIYMKGFGYRSLKRKKPIDVNTVFRIGSLSKGFASLLTGIQVENGCFDWNEKVKSFVPEFMLKDSAQTERITLKHILSHSTGLPRHAYTTLIEDGMSLGKIIPRLAGVNLIGKEGVHLSYQNVAYSIIEKIIESDYQQDFNSILVEQLFTPLGMDSSGCTSNSLKSHENIAQPHRWNRNTKNYDPTKLNNRFFNAVAAGGIHTSIKDMSTWLQVLLGNRPEIISRETLDTIFTPVVRLGNRRYFRHWNGVKDSWYALGWRTFNYHGRKMIYHSGSVNNYRGEITIDATNKIAICVLFNSTTSFASEAIPIFFEAHDKLNPSALIKKGD